MGESTDLTYYEKNRNMMLNKAKDYYKNNKEGLRREARDKYSNLTEEEEKKTENTGRIDIIICPKKRNKD